MLPYGSGQKANQRQAVHWSTRPLIYFLAADVATRTLWFAAMALFSFDRYSEGMVGKLLVSMGIISGVVLVIVLNTTTPASAGAFGILAVFILAYLCTTSLMTFGLYGISRMLAFVSTTFTARRPVESLSIRKSYYYSTIVALAPVIIISMQSVGGVGIYELALILLLVFLGCVYVTKRTA